MNLRGILLALVLLVGVIVVRVLGISKPGSKHTRAGVLYLLVAGAMCIVGSLAIDDTHSGRDWIVEELVQMVLVMLGCLAFAALVIGCDPQSFIAGSRRMLFLPTKIGVPYQSRDVWSWSRGKTRLLLIAAFVMTISISIITLFAVIGIRTIGR